MERVGWAVGALLVSTAPHLPRMPAWVSLLTVACLAWRIAAAARGWNMIWRWLRMIVAGTVFFGVYVTYGTINGIEAGSALLVVMMDMKVLETARRRDFQVLMFIAYFLVLAQLLFEPAIWTLVYMGASVWVTTTALLQAVRSGPALPVASASRMVGKMMAVSLPVMLVLFLLFPRVPGPFWAMPTRSGSASSGLDDQMSPGSINALSLSDEIAFRVAFEGPVPPPRQRYWRGPVFHQFDGVSWREAGRMPRLRADVEPRGDPVRYRITLEPHDRPWLLALDFPEAWAGIRGFMTFDYKLVARRPVDQLVAYDVVSYPDAVTDVELSEWVRSWSLQLPEGRNPLTVELGRQLREQHRSGREILSAALSRFTREGFVYTLRPGALIGAHPVDEFMFDTRRGFCEHYASAFTVLMRAAGLPARVVTGYQGGQLNPIGGRFIVRQSDAHAWSEVWLDGEGWVRIDPTAAVAPDRIELGLADAVPAGEAAPGLMLRRLRILEQIRQSWDAVDAAWDEWVLGYGPDQQAALLRSFGVGDPDWRWLAGAMAAMLAAVLAVLAAWLAWKYRPPRPDEVQRLYRRYLGILARRGLHRRPWEGPLDFSDRAVAAFPAHAGAIRRITASYVRVRYGPGEPQGELSVMRGLLKAFRPRRRPPGGA
jgi:transglutaminase-like putative cysteine protease